MEIRFFSPSEVTDYFEKGELNQDLFEGETIAICSIADLLDVCEASKKGNIRISPLELDKKFDEFNLEDAVRKGFVSVIDLNQDNLSSALFERDGGTVMDLWRQAANQNISPKRSIRYLTLRITDDSIWWSEDVNQEMEEYHRYKDK